MTTGKAASLLAVVIAGLLVQEARSQGSTLLYGHSKGLGYCYFDYGTSSCERDTFSHRFKRCAYGTNALNICCSETKCKILAETAFNRNNPWDDEGTCAPACQPSWIKNSKCDPQCDTPDCGYDGGDCGDVTAEGSSSYSSKHFTITTTVDSECNPWKVSADFSFNYPGFNTQLTMALKLEYKGEALHLTAEAPYGNLPINTLPTNGDETTCVPVPNFSYGNFGLKLCASVKEFSNYEGYITGKIFMHAKLSAGYSVDLGSQKVHDLKMKIDCGDSGLGGGAIAGIVIAVLLVVIVGGGIGAAYYAFVVKRVTPPKWAAPLVARFVPPAQGSEPAQPASQFTNIAQAPPQAVQMADAAKPDVVAVAVESGGGVPADIAALLNEAKIPVEKCGAALVDSGVEKAADLADLSDSDFADMGLSKIDIKRLRKAAEARAQ